MTNQSQFQSGPENGTRTYVTSPCDVVKSVVRPRELERGDFICAIPDLVHTPSLLLSYLVVKLDSWGYSTACGVERKEDFPQKARDMFHNRRFETGIQSFRVFCPLIQMILS